jgi:parallel beta-helix repeat protein
VHISNTTISGNTADYQGGGIYGFGVDGFELQGSTISGNVVPQPSGPGSSARGGGGIALGNISAYSHFVNSTITQNYAYSGGGGVALLDTFTSFGATFYQTTIAGNSAQAYDTGIGITALGGGKPLISASIVANNFSQSSADDLAGSFTANYSLIKSPGAATVSGTGSLIGVDPQLGSLADNGGTTLTLLPSATSPVIDKAPCGSTCNVDQRGAPRSHPKADMGAVERQFPEQLIFRNGFEPD